MNKTHFAWQFIVGFCLYAGQMAAADRPNILLIVSDDHGYADVGFQGCTDIPTLHLDRLPMTETLLPEFPGDAGYKTGWTGNWHLGAATEFRPENRGFTETFGFVGGGRKFLNWQVNIRNEYTVALERNGKPEKVTLQETIECRTDGRKTASPALFLL